MAKEKQRIWRNAEWVQFAAAIFPTVVVAAEGLTDAGPHNIASATADYADAMWLEMKGRDRIDAEQLGNP